METSQLKNWSTPSELSVLKTKPNKSLVSFNPHQLLKRWTSPLSLKFSDSVETEPAKPPSVNFSNTLTLTNKELSAQKNSKELLLALDKTFQLLKSTKWSTMLIRIEMESLTSTNSPMSSPKNTQKSDLYKGMNIFLKIIFSLVKSNNWRFLNFIVDYLLQILIKFNKMRNDFKSDKIIIQYKLVFIFPIWDLLRVIKKIYEFWKLICHKKIFL